MLREQDLSIDAFFADDRIFKGKHIIRNMHLFGEKKSTEGVEIDSTAAFRCRPFGSMAVLKCQASQSPRKRRAGLGGRRGWGFGGVGWEELLGFGFACCGSGLQMLYGSITMIVVWPKKDPRSDRSTIRVVF